MGDYLESVLEKLLGKRCRIETTDGSIWHETIHSIGFKEFSCPEAAGGKVNYPTILYYDDRKVEGIELSILHSIAVDELEEGAA